MKARWHDMTETRETRWVFEAHTGENPESSRGYSSRQIIKEQSQILEAINECWRLRAGISCCFFQTLSPYVCSCHYFHLRKFPLLSTLHYMDIVSHNTYGVVCRFGARLAMRA